MKNPNADHWQGFPDQNERLAWDMESASVRFESPDECEFDEMPVFERMVKHKPKTK